MSTLTHAQRLAWKNKVLRGDSARDLAWLIRVTEMDDEDYPVSYPNGKREAAELRIQETTDSVMKQLKADEKKELKRGHNYILGKMKNDKTNISLTSIYGHQSINYLLMEELQKRTWKWKRIMCNAGVVNFLNVLVV